MTRHNWWITHFHPSYADRRKHSSTLTREVVEIRSSPEHFFFNPWRHQSRGTPPFNIVSCSRRSLHHQTPENHYPPELGNLRSREVKLFLANENSLRKKYNLPFFDAVLQKNISLLWALRACRQVHKGVPASATHQLTGVQVNLATIFFTSKSLPLLVLGVSQLVHQ